MMRPGYLIDGASTCAPRFVTLLMCFLQLVLSAEISLWVVKANFPIRFHLIVMPKDCSVQILFLYFQRPFSFLVLQIVILSADMANLRPGFRLGSLLRLDRVPMIVKTPHHR